MTKTQNYNLPQWAAEDPLRREDFNAAFAAIDKMGYVTGNYIGNGLTMDEGGTLVALPFRPRFVIVSRGWLYSSGMPNTFLAVGEKLLSGLQVGIRLETNGFRVAYNADLYINLNLNNTSYSYIAFQ